MKKLKVLLEIFKDWKLTLSLLVGIVLLFSSIPFLAPIGFILVFNFYDMLGFRNLLEGEGKDYDTKTASYRIIQGMFEIVLLLLIAFMYNIETAIISKFLHLFALQDILYYWIGNYTFPKTWRWLYWTPVGWFWKDRQKGIPTKIIFLQAALGTIACVITQIILYLYL